MNWATGIDPATGRPIENPDARYDQTGRAFAVQPSSAGAHNWHPMAYHPGTGLVYLSASDNSLVYAYDRNFNPNPLASNLGIDLAAGAAELGPNATADLPNGTSLLAWNPTTRQPAWSFDSERAGILATGGDLVFKGNNSGLAAYDAWTGESLWTSIDMHTGVVAAPISYELDGEQYLAVVAGSRSGNYYAPDYSRLLVFKLGSDGALPPALSFTPPTLNPPPRAGTAAQIAEGQSLYEQNCFICHADPGTGGYRSRIGLFPDLFYASALNTRELFEAVVLDGVRSNNGMVSFAEVLDAEDAEAIRVYLIDGANTLLEN